LSLHDLNSLAYGCAVLARERRLQGGQLANGLPQRPLRGEDSLLRDLLFFLNEVCAYMASFLTR